MKTPPELQRYDEDQKKEFLRLHEEMPDADVIELIRLVKVSSLARYRNLLRNEHGDSHDQNKGDVQNQ